MTFDAKKSQLLITASAIFVVISTCLSCSKEKETKTVALPDGTYSVSRPVCSDTKKNPVYTNPVQPAVFRDYVDMEVAKITVSGMEVSAVVKDKDCSLTNGQKIFYNSGSVVTFTKQTTNTWEPAACKLSVEVNGEQSEVDQDLKTSAGAKVYAEATSSEQGGSFDVTAAGEIYTLTLGFALSDFGCADGAKFQWLWTKEP